MLKAVNTNSNMLEFIGVKPILNGSELLVMPYILYIQ